MMTRAILHERVCTARLAAPVSAIWTLFNLMNETGIDAPGFQTTNRITMPMSVRLRGMKTAIVTRSNG